jgi:hypothetical protein
MKSHTENTNENKKESFANSNDELSKSTNSTFQFVDNRPEAITQMKMKDMLNNSAQNKQAIQLQKMINNGSSETQQTIQKKENNTGLPDNLKTGMENLSGMSMDDVKVHRNSAKPAQLQAHAYAQGTDIHLGPGQEKHLPHELGHVVQQKEGRVKPTMQMKGKVNVNDDTGLEKEADVMGAEALQKETTKAKSINTVKSTGNTVQKKVINNENLELTDKDAIIGYLKGNVQKDVQQGGKTKTNIFIDRLIKSKRQLTIADLAKLKFTEKGLVLDGETIYTSAKELSGDRSDTNNLLNNDDEETHFKKNGIKGSKKNWKGNLLAGEAERPEGGEQQRKEGNINLLLNQVPKIKLKKGTWISHMTKGNAEWMRHGDVGGNDPNSYSFFCMASRGGKRAHSSGFTGALTYMLTQDVYALYIQDYGKIQTKHKQFLIGTEDDSGEEQTIEKSGKFKLGGDFADSLIKDVPASKRPIAFVSLSESELVFLSSMMPKVMKKIIFNEENRAKASADGGMQDIMKDGITTHY